MAADRSGWGAKSSDIAPLWRAVRKAVDAGEWPETKDSNAEAPWRLAVALHRKQDECVVRSPPVHIRDERGLGFACRLHLLDELLHFDSRQKAFTQAARRAGKPDLSAGSWINVMQLGNAAGPKKGLPHEVFLEGFATWARDVNPGLTKELLFETTYDGDDAVRLYREVLGVARDPTVQPLIGVRSSAALAGVFDTVLGQLSGFVAGSERNDRESRARTPGVAQVVTGALPSMQRTLATKFTELLKEEGETRPVLVIPVGGDPVVPALGVDGRVVPTTPDVHTMVAWLRHFFDSTKSVVDIANVDPVGEDRSLFHEIHELRLAMVRRPAVLVFVGVSARMSERSPIEHQVADSDLVRLLSRIVSEPPICSSSEPDLMNGWRENRVVLIADRDMLSHLHGEAKGPKSYKTVPKPDYLRRFELEVERDVWLGEVERLELPNAKDLTKALRRLDKEDIYRSECFLYLMDAIHQVRGTYVRHQEIRDVAHDESKVCTRLCTLWLDALRDKAQAEQTPAAQKRAAETDLALIQLLATAPEGYRKDSLQRVVGRLRANREPSLSPLKPTGLVDAIAGLLSRFPRLVSGYGSDGVRSVDTSAHELEFDFAHVSASEDEEGGRALHFPIVEVRYGVLEWMGDGENMSRHHFHRLHRTIAEEVKQQMTIVLRHFDVDRALSLRVWRRQFSMLYHGLLSIELCFADDSLRINNFVSSRATTMEEGADLWIWLYSFALRRMVERVPAYNLVRYYGADSLKRLLLMELFDDPAALWPAGYRISAGLSAAELERGVDRTDPDLGLILEPLSLVHLVAREQSVPRLEYEHWRSLAQVCLSLGDVRGAEEALDRLRSYGGGSVTTVLSCKKIELDSATLGLDLHLESARNAAELIRQHFGDAFNKFERELTATRERILEVIRAEIGDADKKKARTKPCLPTRFVSPADIVKECMIHQRTPGEIAGLADVLFRIAEHHGILTTLDESQESEVREEIDLSILRPKARVHGGDSVVGYANALAVFLMAESLRLAVFRMDPMGSSFFASGGVTRQMVRVCLALERHVLESRAKSMRNRHAITSFGRLARQQADTLTRHLFRYPREQASELLIEAEILRTRSVDPEKRCALLMQARTLCAEAEPIVLGLGRELRLRLRLAMTRLKIHRDLVYAGEDEGSFFQQLWEADVRFLESHPITSRFQYWSKVVGKRVEELEQYRTVS